GTRRRRYITDRETPWFPWPDKETCVLDILRHVPRCAFSNRQNEVIQWALLALGVKDVPSEHAVQEVTRTLQRVCGISSIRYKGAMGHIYYVNDLAAIIAQEMANPQVRPHLRFLPEDAGKHLSEAWQGTRWRDELDPNLAAPMVRVRGTDFFVHEPVQLRDGSVCMPYRWFRRNEETYAKAWGMARTADGTGYIVLKHVSFDVNARELLSPFPMLVRTARFYNLPNPTSIIGILFEVFICLQLTKLAGVQEIEHGGIHPWTHTDPREGNRWRKLARGHRVIAFPIWLYCDDTSGNLSKKWNKHNSFLFTAAGLPRRFVHREYNIHFLTTSNAAPPLEMLDGIVEQLRDCQESGIWAWDCEEKELVLVVPSVLAMLGDNPMQSEIACHIGLAGNLFCRVCKVSKGSPDTDEDVTADDEDARSVRSGSEAGSEPRTREQANETMAEMVDRIQRFMTIGLLRNRGDTLRELKSQFTTAQDIGGQASVKRARTRTGLRDMYQSFFVDRLFSFTTKRGRTREEKSRDVAEYLRTVPWLEESATSPVWRIPDFDPHSDTPVEILHVILLGFVKYLWRDTVSRLKDPAKNVLIARLSSFDVTGLGVAPLLGGTLVNYAKSLVGRDFRLIAQVAPFVLHDLPGIPEELHKVWIALSRLIPLVWQPEIVDFPSHTVRLQDVIDRFLDSTCELTPRWFNKPKFHILLHLPEHIRRFGPAMLFATEGFESYNAIIRSHSIHSNHRAPSRDIAAGMAQNNRIRHLLSGGFFTMPHMVDGREDPEIEDEPLPAAGRPHSSWLRKGLQPEIDHVSCWRSIGTGPASLLALDGINTDILNLFRLNLAVEDDSHRIGLPHSQPRSHSCRTAEKLLLHEDGWYKVDARPWILYRAASTSSDAMDQDGGSLAVGRLREVIQVVGSRNEAAGRADFVVIQKCAQGTPHPYYDMPRITTLSDHELVPVMDIVSAVNVQHNCHDHSCALTETRVVRQEHEETSQRATEVCHAAANDYILNTAQMRSSALIMPLYPPLP
ncbi:uncharacterized protein TRAVEDRAFT_93301, partial [Trametes versicolor FP-101664 SS1]|uniref:uncharacterized protein n=1 Tax=Trametes versicolor (strain FP-101664) TaxID=717944 RepID=UPI0004622DAF